jgi:peptide/nickel transport system substrate-binding protein
MKPNLGSLFAGLLATVAAVALSTVPETGWAQENENRLVFVSAGFDESNRTWDVSKPDHVQFDPFLETLLEVDPATGAYGPRLATEWEHSPDFKTWTFKLREDVPFHSGYGEFTAKDVVHSHSLMVREDSIATLGDLWRQAHNVEAIDDYTVAFHFENPVVKDTAEYAFARSGDLKMVSKAQFDKEGEDAFKRPAGTGSYEFVERSPGLNIIYKAVEDHWSGVTPAFDELEIRIAKEPATRLAMLLSGEAHVGDLPRELHQDAVDRGLNRLASTMSVDWVSVYFGGMYFTKDDPDFNPEVPWTDVKVRQALNMAVDRQELLDVVFAGRGEMAYISNWTSASEGWDPAWKDLYEELYPYDPERAKELLAEAGYAPGELKMEIWAYSSPGESEHPAIADALGLYFNAIGVDVKVELLDWAKVRGTYRAKEIGCCLWPNVISWRPALEGMRNWYWSESNSHHFEDDFLDAVYEEWNNTLDTDRRNELSRSAARHLIENFAEIPLFWFRNEVFANGDVVGSWTYPGLGAGRTTQWDLIKPAGSGEEVASPGAAQPASAQ